MYAGLAQVPVLVPYIAILQAKPHPEVLTEFEVVNSVVKTCSDGAFQYVLRPMCRDQQDTPGYLIEYVLKIYLNRLVAHLY